MFEDIFPDEERKPKKKKRRKKINLYPKGQTVTGRTINKTVNVGPTTAKKPSKKAKATMKRALDIRKYIKEGEKNKE